ncbi:MAG: hypothetical protein K9H26_01905 [Prolixibacteraceae bacterium]|nr:hypothetical protein [Prolixibacteraceae bacterium]
MKNKIVLLIVFCFLGMLGHAQYAYRIEANIFTKTRLADSTFQISKGTLFYDKNIKKIIFDFTFPEREKVVLFDTIMYTFRADTLYSKSLNLLIPDQSLFHFMLSGKMANFGLDEANFEMKGFEKKKDMIITTWIPPEHMKEIISKVLIATKNKLLYSVTMVDAEGEVMNRQILKNYEFIQGIEIPSELLIATYAKSGTIYQVINLDNIILNDPENDANYDKEL